MDSRLFLLGIIILALICLFGKKFLFSKDNKSKADNKNTGSDTKSDGSK